jgi:biopolymer transport protein ExbD
MRCETDHNRHGPLLDGLALGLMSCGLCLLMAALISVPQRLGQRSSAQGVLSLHLQADGRLRLWNRPVQEKELRAMLAARDELQARAWRLRLIPDRALPWGVVQERVASLEKSGLALELQLP